LGCAALPLSKALHFDKKEYTEQRLKLKSNADGRLGDVTSAVVHVRFRSLDVMQLASLRSQVKDDIDSLNFQLWKFEQILRNASGESTTTT